jgi:hypothetical protein
MAKVKSLPNGHGDKEDQDDEDETESDAQQSHNLEWQKLCKFTK